MYAPEDRTAKAIIRDTALAVFGEHGPAAASLKAVAERAGVSQSLIIKHYGSRDGLIAAVDAHVLGVLGNALGSLADAADDARMPEGFLSAARALDDPATTRYLSYLLLDRTPRSAAAYQRLQDFGTALMRRMREAGAVAPDVDHARLAAILMAHELSLILLRDRLTETLGDDPMSPHGLRRWWSTLQRLYAGTAIGASEASS